MEYRAHYRDDRRDCRTVIRSEEQEGGGYELHMTIDGIHFVGGNLCDFELEQEGQAEQAAEKFHLLKWGGYLGYGGQMLPYTYALQRYGLEVEIPVEVAGRATGETLPGMITLSYYMKEYDKTRVHSRYLCGGQEVYPDDTICTEFSLQVGEKRFTADRPTVYFEQALLQICEKCKDEFLLRCCFTCQYSDYSPYGCDDFGSMLCYRKHKEVYLTVNDKDGYFEKLEGLDFEIQQETNLCGEFEERTRCEGYRGLVEGKYIIRR